MKRGKEHYPQFYHTPLRQYINRSKDQCIFGLFQLYSPQIFFYSITISFFITEYFEQQILANFLLLTLKYEKRGVYA